MGRVIFLVLFLVGVAHADPPENRPPDNRPPDRSVEVGGTTVDVNTPVTIDVPITIDAPVTVDAPVEIHEGSTNLNQSWDYERQVPDQFISYTPNYIQCMRTFGLQFANTKFSSFLGFPLTRDAACDMWIAVDEAQQNGHILLSYGFMCQVRNVQKVWGKERCDKLMGQALTWLEDKMAPEVEYTTESEEATEVDHALFASVEHDKIVKELEATKEKVSSLERELAATKQQQQQVQQAQQVQQQQQQQVQQTDELRQYELSEFLKKLEKRGDK